jgi:hypothetical protein
MSWIEQKAIETKRQDEAVEDKRKWQLHAAETIRRRGHEATEELARTVQLHIGQWNEQFHADRTKFIDSFAKTIPNGFTVRRSYYPAFTLHVGHDLESQVIHYEFSKKKSSDAASIEGHGQFRMLLGEDSNIYLADRNGNTITFEDASQLLLEPLL